MTRGIVGLLLALALGGCASAVDTKMPSPPPPVKPAPKYSPEALDPALRIKARDELQAQADSPDQFLRCHAIEAISDVDPVNAAPIVLKGLTDTQPSVRFAAAMAAGKMKLLEAYRPLLAMADDPNQQVEIGVRFALHRLGDTRLSHELEQFAASPDPHIRGTTAFVLGLLRDPSATPMLLRLSADRAPSVRIQAAEALWRLGDERGLKDLVAYTISAYPDDQMIALPAIAETGDQRVIQHVRGQLDSDFEEVSLAAARALGMLGSDEGWNVAVPAAHSKDPRQRSLAALAMGAIGRSDLQEYLKDLLSDPEPSVRISAATAILQLRGPAEAGSTPEY
jgi:HEAT repeat protein